jgi:polysaccharide biosynthesis transport protein
MAKDERLLPLPSGVKNKNLQYPAQQQDIPSTYAPLYDSDQFAEKRSIREYLNVVLKRKWLILAIVAIVTLSTAIYMYRQPSIYSSQAMVLIETRAPRQSSESVYINLWYDTKYWDTQLRLIQNPELMRDAVIVAGLHKNPNLFGGQNNNPSFFGAVRNMLFGAPSNASKSPTLPVVTSDASTFDARRAQLTPEEAKRADEYAQMLTGGLTVEPVEKTNLITLRYTHTNPELAAIMPNAVAKAFIAKDTQREMQGAIEQTEDNARQIAELQATINNLENERIGYLQNADLPLQEKGQNLLAERLQTYSANWLAAEDERRKIQAQYEAAQRAKEKGEIYSVVDNNLAIQKARELNRVRNADLEKRIEDYDKKIAELEQEKAKQLVTRMDLHPDVVKITDQINIVRQQKVQVQKEISAKIQSDDKKLLREAENETLTGLQARFQAATRRENELRAAYFRERAAANEQGLSEVKLTNLTQEIESNRKLLDGALKAQKELELQANNSRPNNISLQQKSESAGLVGPNRQRNIMMAFLISLAAGIGLAFLLDYLDDSIKSSDDIGRHLGLPTLALIPHQNSAGRATIRGAVGQLAAAGNGNGAIAASTALSVLDDSRSALAEAYRHLRTSLLFSSAGKPPQSILITSAQPSEGKTTTAINTAITLAQGGADVVLVDCDLRRPRLHHHFQLDNTHGITNFLSGERNTSELLKPVERLPNLRIITSGPIPPNPAELLSSAEMRNLVEFLRGNFKHVIIDSPPAISFTDSAILSTLVDGVVIVAMANKSSIHLIRRFKQRLNSVGARIYGVVLNGLKRHSLDYGYYGYGYSYYYNQYGDEETAEALSAESGNNGNRNGF